jgi:lipid A 4'-phosphatase
MRTIIAIVAFGIAAAILFVAFPEIDLATARSIYIGDNRFLFSGLPAAIAWGDVTRLLAQALVIALVVGLVLTVSLRRPILGLRWRGYLFLLLCFGIGAGVIASAIFKDNWGRARPSQIVEFGGDKRFTPAFEMTDQCPKNCSFVSADVAFAFGTLGIALLAGRRPRFVAAALTLGVIVGLGRMLTGSHFLSDVIFSGVFSVLTVLLLERLILARPPPRPPAA